MQLVGKTFRKRIEKHEMGSSPSFHQDWKVVNNLDNGTYSCVRVDETKDPVYAASVHRRVFKEEDIIKWLNNKE